MFNTVIERFKEAQLRAFESYLQAARFEKECMPNLAPSLSATWVRKESELNRELEMFCVRLARGAVETVQRWVSPGVVSFDAATEIRTAEADIKDALAIGEVPDLDAFWVSLSQRFNVPVGTLQ